MTTTYPAVMVIVRSIRVVRRAEAIPGGPHLFTVTAAGVDLAALRMRLLTDGIHAPEASAPATEPTMGLGVNDPWKRTTGAALAEAFHRAAGGAVQTA